MPLNGTLPVTNLTFNRKHRGPTPLGAMRLGSVADCMTTAALLTGNGGSVFDAKRAAQN